MDKKTFEIPPQPKPTPTLYTIPSLEWEDLTPKTSRVRTIIGDYEVRYYEGGGGYKWYYRCLDDVVAIQFKAFLLSAIPCTSIKHGKAQAEAHYREQLGKCLEVWNG